MANNDLVQQMTDYYLDKVTDALADGSDVSGNTFATMAALQATLMPFFALNATLTEHPEYTAKQVMAHVGNRAVCAAIKNMDDEFIERLEEMRKERK